MTDQPATHLCSSCTHRRVCYIRRDNEIALSTFKSALRGYQGMRIEVVAAYDVPKCGEYEEVKDGILD